MTSLTRFRFSLVSAAVAAIAIGLAPVQSTEAATINISSLETVLAEPDNSESKSYALWTGWFSQVYEYNMPFIEIDNSTPVDDRAITSFTMTIGDTDFNFSNEFKNKDFTNSKDFIANGEFAVLGGTTPDIAYTSRIEDGGDTLVVEFLNGGIAPGEVARFQVDINTDDPNDFINMYAPYNEVFFTANGGPDTSNNSVIGLGYETDPELLTVTLPNYDMVMLTGARPYTDMQMIDIFPDVEVVIPEPGSLMLVLAGIGALAARRAS